MNEQLQEYSVMAEKMAETRERNRLAREIHDTLGHTLTGIAAGIDACLATIGTSPRQTKDQLELIPRSQGTALRKYGAQSASCARTPGALQPGICHQQDGIGHERCVRRKGVF